MDTRKFAMNQGAVLGLCLVCIALFLWMLGINEQKSIVPSLLNNVVIIWFLVYSISQYRDRHNNGCISYSESLKLGTSVAFFSSLIMAFYTIVYAKYLDPDMLSNILKMTEQSVLQSNPEISEDELDLALEMTSKLTQPHWIMIMSVLGGTFMGFFLSLFISFFTKKEIERVVVKEEYSEDSTKEFTTVEDNFENLANREFQHKNFIGTKTNWKFNQDGRKVNIRSGWLGINTVNATCNIESLGDGVFIGKGLINVKFTVEENRIKLRSLVGPVVLNEIK